MIPVRLFLAFAFGYFLTHLFRVVNAVAGPAFSAELSIDTAGLGFLTASYFLAFAAFQLPLGIFLDRYSPSRVQALMLLIAAAGACLFAVGDGLAALTVARAMIGLGVSAGLMAAFKAYSAILPPEKLPLANGLHMAAGSLGVLAGGLPVELAMHALGWRGLFLSLGVLSVAAAAVLFFGVRDSGPQNRGESFRALAGGVAHILAAPAFIRLAPLSVAVQASGLALIALWVGPWLREVAGYTPDGAATIVSLMGVAMISGYALCAVSTNRLVAKGVPLSRIMIGGYVVYCAVFPVIILIDPEYAAPIWLVFAMCISFGPLSYPVLGALFSGALTGRVHTALNFLVFAVAFALQWAFGVALKALTPSLGVEGAYDAALWGLVGLQAASFVWYVAKAPARDPLLAE